MPVYNAVRHLDAAIASIRAQTLAELELIVVDDGSTDDSADLLARHAAADPRISVLRIPHAGVATALNHGINAARAPLIARMDGDDEALPDRLERQMAFLSARPDVVVLGTGLEVIDLQGRPIETNPPITDPADIHELLLLGNCLAHPTVMMRRDAVLAAGGYRPAFTAAEDYDLWLRLSERHALANLPDRLLRYRTHGGQATARHWRVRPLQVLAAQHVARLRRAGRPDPMAGFSRIDAATLRAIGVPRAAILAALDGQDVTAPPLRRGWRDYFADVARRRTVPTSGVAT